MLIRRRKQEKGNILRRRKSGVKDKRGGCDRGEGGTMTMKTTSLCTNKVLSPGPRFALVSVFSLSVFDANQ